MRTGRNFYRFPNVIDDDICKKIINLAEDNWKKAGLVGTKNPDPKMRSGEVFFTFEEWIHVMFVHYMRIANKKAEWNFEISEIGGCQISKYSLTDHYNYHLDSLGTHATTYNEPSNKHYGKTRKISMSLTLNSEFEGGELVFVNNRDIGARKGTPIFFPSFLPHKVRPVTKGTRYSLVIWFLGKPWV